MNIFTHQLQNKYGIYSQKKIKIRTKTHFTAGITPVQKPNFSTNLLEKTTKCLKAKYRRSHHKPEQLHSWIHPTSGKHK